MHTESKYCLSSYIYVNAYKISTRAIERLYGTHNFLSTIVASCMVTLFEPKVNGSCVICSYIEFLRG